MGVKNFQFNSLQGLTVFSSKIIHIPQKHVLRWLILRPYRMKKPQGNKYRVWGKGGHLLLQAQALMYSTIYWTPTICNVIETQRWRHRDEEKQTSYEAYILVGRTQNKLINEMISGCGDVKSTCLCGQWWIRIQWSGKTVCGGDAWAEIEDVNESALCKTWDECCKLKEL